MAEKLTTKDIRVGNFVNGGTPLGAWIIEEEDYHAMLYDGVEFEGLPLTPEWLLKFGFERISSNVPNLFRRELDSQRNMRFDSEDGFRIETKGSGWGWIMPQIKQVHQLQNLHFALTGQELTA